MDKLEFENDQILNLIQAMMGDVSPNFRRVNLEVPSPNTVRLYFLLERESPQDREAIEDIEFEFSALQEANIGIETSVIVDSRELREIDLPGRGVYGRKE